ncbi:hypothetical protein Vadar_031960 [Vaccinium darrowii]|uniref:Uncharacterized protein n=1 Tax=Vaccinium darrowii TaxID=229202 RepID=A0ACB7YII6_9ERIC|nr:hypothetical protein Vadar_031960 [Vaccinium darrowii]
MVVVFPRKRLVLVAFFLLCFISTTAKVVSCSHAARSVPEETCNAAEKGDETFIPKAKGELSKSNGDQDLVTMDYNPVQRRPPIHN